MDIIKITHAIQLSKSILFLLINNQENGESDAILMTTSCKDVLLPKNINSLEQTLLWPDDIQSGDNCEYIIFEIDNELLDNTESWCTEVHITFEKLIYAFIRFCASENNHAALKEWFDTENSCAYF